MTTKSKTVRCRYHFKVSEYGDGQTWISLEPQDTPPSELENRMIGFDLADGTPIEKAREIASYLNANLKDLSSTTFLGA